MDKEIVIDGMSLTLEQVEQVAVDHYQVKLADGIIEKINKSRDVIEQILNSGKIVYGINTGFGYLKNTVISVEEIENLQENLILSHAAGVGECFPESVVRAMLLLRTNALIKGFSGIRYEVIELLLNFLNFKITPLIPSKGSVGASGDLAPLAHMVLPLIGKGKVLFAGSQQNAREVLISLSLEPVRLHAKEGLALINGTQAMTAVGALTLQRAKRLADTADAVAAMTLEALKGSKSAFREELHIIRPHAGQVKVAANMTRFLSESEIMDSHEDCDQVQDAYSLRCIPQVHGAVRDTLEHAEKVITTEMNSVTDNPIVLPDTGEVISCGNFHGEPVAVVMDFLSIALSELASISERRIERMVNPQLSNGLPAFLTGMSGINSGYMIAQYTAAALVSENKSFAHPASVDSIPTSANQEDHVSMGTIGARKTAMILQNVENVLAIEALCAAQGLEFRKPLKPSVSVGTLYEMIRNDIKELKSDRNVSRDIYKSHLLITSKEFYEKINNILR
jgi:histidine ammonia-lyase